MVCLLRGRAYEACQNRQRAAECFKEALRIDAYCYDSFRLVQQVSQPFSRCVPLLPYDPTRPRIPLLPSDPTRPRILAQRSH